ncbi:MAG: SH3 domain-containing protein [Acidobacteria bacterium]|nr:SH3 domain-containing protein [Acidobacteriota bacterium]
MRSLARTPALVFLLLAVVWCGCDRGRGKSREVAYVSAPQAILRDQVAAVFNKVAIVRNAERLEVLDRDRRFVKVRTANGAEGWLEQRYVVTQQVFEAFQKLARDEARDPVQTVAITRNDTNLHISPARSSDHLYQLSQGTKVDLWKRATSEKVLPGAQPAKAPAEGKPAPPPVMEDWWLIRDPLGHVGWVLGRLLDVDVPIEIAQYAEGQRIVASFVLNEVVDGDKKVPQYLMLLNEPKDGQPFDFNQIRVFTWNVKRHRYETAYRERNLKGALPATVSQENFEKEGMLPVFTVHVTDDTGKVLERKYKLNTPIVRRVLAPGEVPAQPVARKRRR